jgi:glycerol-3-phosphate dehydrogenase
MDIRGPSQSMHSPTPVPSPLTRAPSDGSPRFDVIVIGGGINGAGIARDAAGRGLKVALIEQDDIGGATSSASTKLIHGGLRYLEHYEFRLVRESLLERERLMRQAPHLIHPLRFVVPHLPRARPPWLVRLGLFLYDHLGGRDALPKSANVDLRRPPYIGTLQAELTRGFAYSDCRVDDSRFTLINALDAAERGATVMPRTRFVSARNDEGLWHVRCADQATGRTFEVAARCVVNSAGPWVAAVLQAAEVRTRTSIRLVKGSHIVVPKLYDGDHAFLMQNADQRVVFAIPYEHEYTLIGTTDVPYEGDPSHPSITAHETDYLCEMANQYFQRAIRQEDVRWTYAGVRPLVDDASDDVSKITRDYRLELTQTADGAAMLSVFGGKITTYRTLAQAAVDKLAALFPQMRPPWTANAVLPGGALANRSFEQYLQDAQQRWSRFPPMLIARLVRTYGDRVEHLLGDANTLEDLGEHFGAGLTEAEVAYLKTREWAQSADDILWRRTKLGLHLSPSEMGRIAAYIHAQR